MEKCIRKVNFFYVQIYSKDSTGPDKGDDPFAFSFQLSLPQYMKALEADEWEVALVCIRSTGIFSEIPAQQRILHLLQMDNGVEHKLEIPLDAFKTSKTLQDSVISELQAFFRSKIPVTDELNFNVPICSMDNNIFTISYNGSGLKLIMKETYLYSALGFASRQHGDQHVTVSDFDGVKARRPVDANIGRSQTCLLTDMVMPFPWDLPLERTLAWIPINKAERTIDLFEPRYLSYFPVKYLNDKDTVRMRLTLRYLVDGKFDFSSCPLAGETVVVLHLKRGSEDGLCC